MFSGLSFSNSLVYNPEVFTTSAHPKAKAAHRALKGQLQCIIDGEGRAWVDGWTVHV